MNWVSVRRIRAYLVGGLMGLGLMACETADLADLQSVPGQDARRTIPTPAGRASPLTTMTVEAGLREALMVGLRHVVRQLGRPDGYWGDPRIRIPLPRALRTVQETLSGTPFADPLDDVQLRMNRAVEAAVPAAGDNVHEAIRALTLPDAIGILRGGDTAATDYLRRKTEARLRAAFTPYVDQSLSASGAYRALQEITDTSPLLAGAAADYKAELTDHAVRIGLDGLFHYLGEEERRVRRDPLARTTDLLRRVFGS